MEIVEYPSADMSGIWIVGSCSKKCSPNKSTQSEQIGKCMLKYEPSMEEGEWSRDDVLYGLSLVLESESARAWQIQVRLGRPLLQLDTMC